MFPFQLTTPIVLVRRNQEWFSAESGSTESRKEIDKECDLSVFVRIFGGQFAGT
jgi:hypothetical protein